jgi:transcriptional regulator
MLVHPWDAASNDAEWKGWLAAGHDFGQLIASGRGRDVPVVVPTHFHYDGVDLVELHLARVNPIWAAIEENPVVMLSVVDDYAYIPTTWRATDPAAAEHGVPTSYYSAVQLTAAASIVDDIEGKARILRRQLAALQPEGDFGPVVPGGEPYGRMLSAVRGLELRVTAVAAKFKYDDHKSIDFRRRVAARLESRSRERDAGARQEQLRRIRERGA